MMELNEFKELNGMYFQEIYWHWFVCNDKGGIFLFILSVDMAFCNMGFVFSLK